MVTLEQIKRKVMAAVRLMPEHVVRDRPVAAGGARGPVGGEEDAEADGVADEKHPHAELAPALRGERRLGRFNRRVQRGNLTHVVSLSSGSAS